MDFNTLLKSKKFVTTLAVLSVVVVALLVFAAGVGMGRRMAFFSCDWAKNYERNFGRPHSGFMPPRHGMEMGDPNSHGAVGEIISINLPTFVVASPREPEKTIVITNNTVVLRGPTPSTAADLKVGDHLIVIGSPDDHGEVNAKLIRVLASVPTSSATATKPTKK